MSDKRLADGWLQERDKLRYDACKGDAHAISFLATIMDAVEIWDDLIDKDKPVADANIHRVFINLMFWMPQNQFFNTHKNYLLPIIMTCINAWMDSDALKSLAGVRDRQAAWWLKQMGVELYGSVAFLMGGFDHMREISLQARHVLAHEDFVDFEQENNHA